MFELKKHKKFQTSKNIPDSKYILIVKGGKKWGRGSSISTDKLVHSKEATYAFN